MAATEPRALIVDSIQTVYLGDLESAPGSVSQVRECGGRLMRLAKGRGIAVFLVGHVTKEGALAGPRVLEHLVDTVLYFEGERHATYRVLRAVKNRFGSTNEIGVFEMTDGGLEEVANPSAMFLAERPRGAAGSVIMATLEGTRPLLLELQALVTPAHFGTPRRTVLGADYNRVCLLLAILEKRAGIPLQNQDVFVNVAGGARCQEPAADLAIAVASASSYAERPLAPDVVVLGEVGLTGEVRAIGGLETRLREAAALGLCPGGGAAVEPGGGGAVSAHGDRGDAHWRRRSASSSDDAGRRGHDGGQEGGRGRRGTAAESARSAITIARVIFVSLVGLRRLPPGRILRAARALVRLGAAGGPGRGAGRGRRGRARAGGPAAADAAAVPLGHRRRWAACSWPSSWPRP